MRINKFIAQATGMSRRVADKAIVGGKVTVNGAVARLGQEISQKDNVLLGSKPLQSQQIVTIMLHKPTGYVCSRNGQGSRTIYELLPKQYKHLKPIGRLDKDSSGLLLLTNDGDFAQKLSHPSFNKRKIYEIELDKQLNSNDQQQIEKGVELADGISKLSLSGRGRQWTVSMSEGRNRQIRRTFSALGYGVGKLHRTQIGDHKLSIKSASWQKI